MPWLVEVTDEFASWFEAAAEAVQDDIDRVVGLLEERGPNLPHPYSSGVKGSAYEHMRELRVQSGGHPVRIFYAFDPRRAAILLIGGDKTGDGRFYETYVPIADWLYATYIDEIRRENLIP